MNKSTLRQPEWIAGLLISAVIVWLHVSFWLNVGGLWRDEVNSLNLAGSNSPGDMAKDSFPIFMPLIVRGWLALGLGESDLALRVLGLLVGLGILSALWISPWHIHLLPPLLGLALFGMNSTLIAFGDSIRAYGLGCLMIILTTGAAAKFLRRPSRLRAIWLTLFAVLSVQTLYHNAVLVGAICAGAMAVCLRRKNWPALKQIFFAGSVAAISLLPYLPGIVAGRKNSLTLRSGVSPQYLSEGLHDTLGFPWTMYLYIWGLLIAGTIIYAFIIRRNSQKDENEFPAQDLKMFAGITLLMALIGFGFFIWLAALPTQSWYLLPLMAMAVVCFDIVRVQSFQYLRLALLIFAVATAVTALPKTSQNLDYRLTNVDVWCRALDAEISPEDYVVVVPWIYGISFAHYFKAATSWDTLPPLTDHATHRYDLVQAQLQNTNAIVPVMKRIAATLQSGHRVWVLAGEDWMGAPDSEKTPPPDLPPAPLKDSGWSEVPYTKVWSLQIGHYLAGHSQQFGRVKNPTAGMRIAENSELFLASGWKDANAATIGTNANITLP